MRRRNGPGKGDEQAITGARAVVARLVLFGAPCSSKTAPASGLGRIGPGGSLRHAPASIVEWIRQRLRSPPVCCPWSRGPPSAPSGLWNAPRGAPLHAEGKGVRHFRPGEVDGRPRSLHCVAKAPTSSPSSHRLGNSSSSGRLGPRCRGAYTRRWLVTPMKSSWIVPLVLLGGVFALIATNEGRGQPHLSSARGKLGGRTE